jgi:hypothetical protein
MSYRIDPAGYCTTDGCSRPKATGEDLCPLCLGQGLDAEAGTTSVPARPAVSQLPDIRAREAKPPRCVAYLSQAGDVITLELTGEPKFTEADVELVAYTLSTRRTAA